MTEYYFVSSLLPQLEIGYMPPLGFQELMQLLRVNLKEADKEIVRHFLRLIDFENLRAFWAHEPFDARGNVSKDQMEPAILHEMWPEGEEFPFYLKDYLAKYRDEKERLYHFPLLMSLFFNDEIENEEDDDFVRDYFAFQREMRLVMVGFRAKKLGKDVSAELQYEDSADPIVAQILAQKDAKTYEPPFEYKELKPIFEEFSDSPMALNKAFYAYQFNYLIDLHGTEIFSLDRILNYMARLILVERWLELDVQKGIQVVDTIEKEIS